MYKGHVSHSSEWERTKPARPAVLTRQGSIMEAEVTMTLGEGLVGEHGQGCGAGRDQCLDEIETVWGGE